MRKIYVSDFTLKKFAQMERELLFREKKSIAACIDAIGADQIDLPPVVKEKEDRIIDKTIGSMVSARLAIPVGYDETGVETAWDCVKEAKDPCLQVILPVATAQMEYGFRAKEAAMLENIKTLVSAAAARCRNVEFTAQDATRADAAFVQKAVQAAVSSGANAIVLSDDTGTALPEEIAALVKTVKEVCAVPMLVSLADQIGMANTCAYAAIEAGADGVKSAMAGSDVLMTERFAAMIAARGASIGVCTDLKTTELHRDISRTMQHLHHDTPTSAAKAETDFADVYLDADSSLSDVCEATRSLGYTLTDEDNGKLYKVLQNVCQKKSSIGSKELEALIAAYAMQAPSTYHLSAFSANCSSIGAAMAQVTLRRGEETLLGVATGDGPIDAAFRAIEQCVGTHYELDEFQIQAVTEGKEALGSTLVRLRSNGKLFAGNGLSSDIVGASIRAYINALNKIVFEEN